MQHYKKTCAILHETRPTLHEQVQHYKKHVQHYPPRVLRIHKARPSNWTVTINDVTLQLKDIVRDVGVLLDSELTMKQRVNRVIFAILDN